MNLHLRLAMCAIDKLIRLHPWQNTPSRTYPLIPFIQGQTTRLLILPLFTFHIRVENGNYMILYVIMVISGAGNFGCKCVLPLQLIRPRPRAVSSPYDKIDNLKTWIWLDRLDCVNVMTTRTQLSKMKSCGVVDRVFVSSVPSTIKRIRYTAIWCTTADINYHRLVMTKKWKNAETLGVRNKPTYALWSFGSGKAMTDRRQNFAGGGKFCKPGQAHAPQISKKSYSMRRKSPPGNLPVKLWLESWEDPTWRIWRTFNATLPATSHLVTGTCFWTRDTAMHHNQIYQPPHHYYIILIYCIDSVKIQKAIQIQNLSMAPHFCSFMISRCPDIRHTCTTSPTPSPNPKLHPPNLKVWTPFRHYKTVKHIAKGTYIT